MNDARPRGKDAEKYKVIDEILAEEYALVHVTTQAEGVLLPDNLRQQPTVTLKFSRFFRKPVFLGKETIRAELLFDGAYFACAVPWKAVWGVTSPKGDGKVWAESVPPGVLQELAKVLPEAIEQRRAEQKQGLKTPEEVGITVGPAPAPKAVSSSTKPKRPKVREGNGERPQLRRVK